MGRWNNLDQDAQNSTYDNSGSGLTADTVQDAIDEIAQANSGDEVQATETVAGIAEIATQAEVDAETDDLRFITPLKLENAANVVHTDGAESIAGLKTFTNDVVRWDPDSASSEWEIGYFPGVTPNCFGVRNTGLSGYFCFFPNASNPQLVMGDPANNSGSGFIDVDNNRPLNLNVLDTGAGTPAVVNIGTGGLNINNPGNLTTGAGSTVTFGSLAPGGVVIANASGVLSVDTGTSFATFTWLACRNGSISTDQALRRQNGVFISSCPYIAPYDATIYAVTAENNPSSTVTTWDFEVDVNGVNQISLSVPNTDHKAEDSALALNINAGDEIVIFMRNASGLIPNPGGAVYGVRR